MRSITLWLSIISNFARKVRKSWQITKSSLKNYHFLGKRKEVRVAADKKTKNRGGAILRCVFICSYFEYVTSGSSTQSFDHLYASCSGGMFIMWLIILRIDISKLKVMPSDRTTVLSASKYFRFPSSLIFLDSGTAATIFKVTLSIPFT